MGVQSLKLYEIHTMEDETTKINLENYNILLEQISILKESLKLEKMNSRKLKDCMKLLEGEVNQLHSKLDEQDNTFGQIKRPVQQIPNRAIFTANPHLVELYKQVDALVNAGFLSRRKGSRAIFVNGTTDINSFKLYTDRRNNKSLIFETDNVRCLYCGKQSGIYILRTTYVGRNVITQLLCHICATQMSIPMDKNCSEEFLLPIFNDEFSDPDVIPRIYVRTDITSSNTSVYDIDGIEKEHKEVHITEHVNYNPEQISLEGANIGLSEFEVSRAEKLDYVNPLHLLDELKNAEIIDTQEEERKRIERINAPSETPKRRLIEDIDGN